MNYEVFTIAEGEWQVRLNGRVLPAVWNSRGAAIAGAQVELRRLAKRAAISKSLGESQ